MRIKGNLVLAVGGLLVALAVGGCGSGDASAGDSAPLSKAELIKQGDAICRHGYEEIKGQLASYFKQHGVDTRSELTPPVLQGFMLEVVVPSLESQIDRLQKLTPPEKDSSDVAGIIAKFEKAADEGRSDPRTLLDPYSGTLGEVGALAKKYGFADCGQTF